MAICTSKQKNINLALNKFLNTAQIL